MAGRLVGAIVGCCGCFPSGEDALALTVAAVTLQDSTSSKQAVTHDFALPRHANGVPLQLTCEQKPARPSWKRFENNM